MVARLGRRQWLQAAGLAGVGLLLGGAWVADGVRRERALWQRLSQQRPSHPLLGQWVWTPEDLALLRVARRARPELVAGVYVGSLGRQGDGVRWKRGLAPARAAGGPVAVVVRAEDELHDLWSQLGSRAMTAALAAALGPLLAELDAAGLPLVQLQLDYDCPVRWLAEYAAALTSLRQGCLAGRALWLTSLPAHLSEPRYAARLEGVVEGHVLQLFDTGLPASEQAALRLRTLLERQPLPFCYGLGAFERVTPAGPTEHRHWWRLGASHLDSLPHFRGRWLFPAGQAYDRLLDDPSTG